MSAQHLFILPPLPEAMTMYALRFVCEITIFALDISVFLNNL